MSLIGAVGAAGDAMDVLRPWSWCCLRRAAGARECLTGIRLQFVSLIDIEIPDAGMTFSFSPNRKTLRQLRRREGRSLLCTHRADHDRPELWRFYIQLTEGEAAFKNLKDDLNL
jgi:hypothetical protein